MHIFYSDLLWELYLQKERALYFGLNILLLSWGSLAPSYTVAGWSPSQFNNSGLLMYTWTTTFCNQVGLHFETMLVKAINWAINCNRSDPKFSNIFVCFDLFYSVPSTPHWKQMLQSGIPTSMNLCSSIPTTTQTHISHICDQDWKAMGWPQWSLQSNRSPSPVSTVYSHTGDDTSCVHRRLGWRTGKRTTVSSEGHYPPDRKFWII